MKMTKITNLVYILVAITTSVILQWTCNATNKDYPKFDVTTNADAKSYSDLLEGFRQDIRDKDLTGTYGFQNKLRVVAARPANKSREFIYINIQAERGMITAAFDKNDLYYMGYAHTADRVKKVRLFKDEPKVLNTIFDDVVDRNNRYYSSIEANYNYLGNRASVGLGAKPLNKFINEEIYTKRRFDRTTDSKLALMVIQTIAEAARFTYIEREIVATFGYNDGFKATPKVKSLQTNWEKISKTVKASVGPKIDLELTDGSKVLWKWSKLQDLVDVIGILKNLG